MRSLARFQRLAVAFGVSGSNIPHPHVRVLANTFSPPLYDQSIAGRLSACQFATKKRQQEDFAPLSIEAILEEIEKGTVHGKSVIKIA